MLFYNLYTLCFYILDVTYVFLGIFQEDIYSLKEKLWILKAEEAKKCNVDNQYL